jgi:DNA-binding NtrC family response regulator
MDTVHPPKDNGDQPVSFDDQVGEKLVGHTVAEVERVLIIRTLCDAEWNRTRAATTLGISVRCLRNKIHEFKKQGIAIPAANRTRPEFASSASCRWLRSQG